MGTRIEWLEQYIVSVLDIMTHYYSQVTNRLHNKKYLFCLISQKKNTVYNRVSLILPYIMRELHIFKLLKWYCSSIMTT